MMIGSVVYVLLSGLLLLLYRDYVVLGYYTANSSFVPGRCF